ncbi:MAG: hypothetical protein ACKVOE_05775 [Rickettsiales bacterium]
MFLFNILFSLLLLPFTLLGAAVRLVFGLLGISTHILLWPLKIFARHTVLCLVIFAAVILVVALKRDPHAADPLKPAAIVQKQVQPIARANNSPAPVIEAVTKRENGDSKFAADLYAMMTDPERVAYSQNFYDAMNKTLSGGTKNWAAGNIQGAIRPVDLFTNNSGTSCRHFAEVLKVHNIEQQITGIACVKADSTWCKLKSNATPACNLGHEAGPFEGITRAIGDLF